MTLKRFKSRVAAVRSDRGFAEIIVGSLYAISGRVAAMVMALGSTMIVARFYGAHIMGILAVLESFLMLATVFTVMGTGTSILRLIPEHTAKYSTTSAFHVYRRTQYLVGAISLVTGGLLFLTSDFVAGRLFSKPELGDLFAIASAFVCVKSLMLLNTQAVRGLHLTRAYGFMHGLPALSMFVLVAAATLLVENRHVPIYAQLGAFAVTALVGMVIVERTFKQRMTPGDTVCAMPVSDIVAISLPMLMATAMTFVISQTGVIMLGMYRTEAEVGYYAGAVKLAGLTAFVLTAINSTAAAKFSQLFHTGQITEVLRVAQKSARLIFWVTTPILLALIVAGKPILLVLFGSEFTVAYFAMVFLVLGQFVNSISGSTGMFLNMTGRQKVYRNLMAGSALLNVGMNAVLIPRFGIEGAAFSAMVTLSGWNVYALLYIKAQFGETIGYFPGVTRSRGSGAERRPRAGNLDSDPAAGAGARPRNCEI
jgi:O-antigen/teichoic acid export membrane protein